MRENFIRKAKALEPVEEALPFPKVGLEVELGLFKDGTPASSSNFPEYEHIDTELGDSQIELRTDPVILYTLENLENELLSKEKAIAGGVIDPVRIGAIPNISVSEAKVTDKEKYRKVPAFHDQNRGSHIDTRIGGIDFNRAACVGLFCSTQVNLQADSLTDAVDKMNRSFMISPYIVAASCNARIMEGKDTHYNDIRMPAWHASHDTRSPEEIIKGTETRIGTPNSYFSSIDDYFGRCLSHPFILDDKDAAFEIGVGLYWLDTRIKFMGNPVVEYRAMSPQPTAKEDIAMTMFYIGRLTYSQMTDEPLMPMNQVHANRASAMKDGLRGKLICDGKLVDSAVAVENELNKAEFGLSSFGYDEIQEYSHLIRDRIKQRETPSVSFAEEIKKKHLQDAVMQYRL
ncbi:MAG: glutamate-cysteine ligase family protein [Candidatus Woesearchaeota archaeon]